MRMVGFSDVHFKLPPDAATYHDTFEAKYITKYLEDYIDSHVYDGTTMRSRVLFGRRVRSVEKTEDSWTICTENLEDAPNIVTTSRLIVATGHHTIPNMPTLPNKDEFKGPVVHLKTFGKVSRDIFASSDCKNITVLGSGKSSIDMVYESVKAGKNVNWAIRKSGDGPPALIYPSAHGQYRNSIEKGATRFTSAFGPSPFAPWIWWARLIHGTSYGRNYVKKMISDSEQGRKDYANYRNREGALPGFELLEPTTT